MEMITRKVSGVDLVFDAPPSKSYTHRAFIAASLAEGESCIKNPLVSGDTEVTIRALGQMGVHAGHEGDNVRITGCASGPRCLPGQVIDMQNSGTSMRLLLSVALLCQNPVVLTGSPRMKERPIGPLVDALNRLGGRIEYLEKTGFPPVKTGGRLKGGTTVIDGTVSSQFISSVLMAAPCIDDDITLILECEPASRSYLDITCDVIEFFGGIVEREGYTRFHVRCNGRYRARDYPVEGDYSSASYFFAIAAIAGGSVTVRNLNPCSTQGDMAFLAALKGMGCTVCMGPSSVTVERSGDLDGIGVNMSSSPDTVQTLCMVAACARTPTTIRGISHLKFKESDRIRITAEGLRSLGADVEISDDEITIRPSPLHGGSIDPHDDHRTAMSFAVLGTATGTVRVLDAGCVNKSFPGFWDSLKREGLV
jgi:3-phosphoshikimate 1-carboxyvinyltransferase